MLVRNAQALRHTNKGTKLRHLIIISVLSLLACNNSDKSAAQTSLDTTRPERNIWVDRLTNAKYPLPDTIAGRPVSFYLGNPKVASIAKSLYSGQFRPEDNDTTTQLLALVVTDDSIIRPFYRWCLDFTIQISDGALGEYPGEPALKYAIKFPKEFFAYMDKDPTGERYNEWTGIIAYSGLNDYTQKATEIQKEITSKMISNCKGCNRELNQRIITFAKDITEAIKLRD